MRLRLTAVATAVALSVVPSLVSAPDTAEVATFSDRLDDARPRLDIERVRVDHGPRVVDRVTFDNLRRSSGGLAVYFNTRTRTRTRVCRVRWLGSGY